MQPQVPDYIRTLVPYVPGKPIEETRREFKIRKITKLASNENPLGPSPRAVRAMRAALPETFLYPDASHYRLKHALAAHLKTAPETITIGNGSNEVIDLLIRTYCLPGDAIATSRAAFIAYRICAQIHGVTTVETPLTHDTRFDLPALAETTLRNPKIKMVFVANPNNPTGTYVTTKEMREFLKSVAAIRDGSVLVVLDYAYWEYVSAKDLPDALELLRDFPNVVVLRTFSKVYGLAGLRIGYGVARPEIVATVEKVRQPFNLNSLGMVAAEAALGDRAFVTRARKVNEVGMKFWERELSAMSVPFWKSQGNFLLIDALKGFGMPGGEVFQACLRLGVILRPVANYGLHHALRISVGTPAENRLAVKALRTVK